MKNSDFQHKKSLGQHFLKNEIVPKWMCDAAELSVGELVLEIGPGTGALTSELLARGAKVVGLEADQRALEVLASKFSDYIKAGNLILHQTDVRELDLTKYNLEPQNYKVVANIPYYLSGHLFRSFLETKYQPSFIVFLVQKEVAKRITTDLARHEKESLLSLSVKAYGNPTYIRTVSRGHFVPPPKVDSAIIAIKNINRSAFSSLDEALFFKVLHLGFGQKRKQLLGNLSPTFSKEEILHSFSTVGLPPSVRAEDIPIQKWLTLVRSLSASS